MMNSNILGNSNPVNLVFFNKNVNNNNNNIFNRLDISDIKGNIGKSNICREHGESITYLCLDCMSKWICPKYVVHGVHRNHEVLNIKKAYPLIYNKTQEIGSTWPTKLKNYILLKIILS